MIIDRLALPLRDVLKALAQYSGNECSLQQNQVTLDFKGNTMLSCAIYDSEKYGVGSFLDTSLEQLQDRKQQNALCSRCMKNSFHVYGEYSKPELHTLALKAVMLHYATYLNETPAVGQADSLHLNVA